MTTFDNLTREQAWSYIGDTGQYKDAKALKAGDLYQNGDGFVGPTLSGRKDEISRQVKHAWAARFVGQDLIGACIKRRVKGVLGKPPVWSMMLRDQLQGDEASEQDQRRLTEANTLLTTWWQDRMTQETLQMWVDCLSWYGKAYLRIVIPRGRMSESDDGTLSITASTVQEALDLIFVEVLGPEQAAQHADSDTMYTVGVVAFERTEKRADGSTTTVKITELSYLSDQRSAQDHGKPLTRLAILTDGSDPQRVDVDLRGHRMLFEGKHDPFCDRISIHNQRGYNTAATEMRVVNDEGGFPQTILSGTLGPGTWDKNDQGVEVFKPEPYQRGPGKDIFMPADPIYGEEGEVKGYAPVGVHQLQPARIESYTQEMAQHRRAILESCHQLFVDLMNDAQSSGDARIQALFDFMEDLSDLKSLVDRAGTWLLESVWYLAQDLSGNAGADHDLKASFSARVSLPYLPSDFIRVLLDQVDKGVLSLETFLSRLGVDDVDEEIARLQASETYQLAIKQKMAVLMGTFVNAGLGIEVAAVAAGFDDETAKRMARMDNVEGQR
ncbi:MAG: hypothetical protein AAGJ10_15760 [Bacteroidota bacterium]